MVQSGSQSSIRVEGLNRLIAQVNRVAGNVVNEELMGEIGTFIATSILQRTAKGQDVEGKNFEPYSPKYKLFRMKTGHKHNIVNLFYSGSMFIALTHTAFKDRVEVFFMNTYGKTPSGKASTVSNPQKAFFLNEKREFFAISADEENAIWEMIQAHLRRLFD
jgi:hypothetical protein